MVWVVALLAMAGIQPMHQANGISALPPIERHRVGSVVLGTDAHEIYDEFPPDRRRLVDLALEGMLSPALLLRFEGGGQRDGVVAELGCENGFVVRRIEVRDPAFKTLKGIGVGSTVGQLRAAYTLDRLLYGEVGFLIRVEELSASFVLDVPAPDRARLHKLRTPDEVPDSLRITSVLLTR